MLQPHPFGFRCIAIAAAAKAFSRPRTVIAGAVLALASAAFAAEGDVITPEERSRGFRSRTLLAQPRENLSAVERAEAVERLKLVRTYAHVGGLRMLEIDGGDDVTEVIDRLKATGLYGYVEHDYVRSSHAVPNDPRFAADQWSLDNTGQFGGKAGADIRAAAAWEIQRDAPEVGRDKGHRR